MILKIKKMRLHIIPIYLKVKEVVTAGSVPTSPVTEGTAPGSDWLIYRETWRESTIIIGVH